jgi:hypothetical protein
MKEKQEEQKLTEEHLKKIVDAMENAESDFHSPNLEYYHIFENSFRKAKKCECCLQKADIRYAKSIFVFSKDPNEAIKKYAEKYLVAIHGQDLEKEENAEYLKAQDEQIDWDGVNPYEVEGNK